MESSTIFVLKENKSQNLKNMQKEMLHQTNGKQHKGRKSNRKSEIVCNLIS